jgi:hypothetical protein
MQGKIIDHIDTLATHRESIENEEHSHEEKTNRLEMEKEQYDDGIIDRRDEMTLKQEELEERKRIRKWDAWKLIGTTVVSTLTTFGLSRMIINFEKEGTLTSSLRNGVLSKILKK